MILMMSVACENSHMACRCKLKPYEMSAPAILWTIFYDYARLTARRVGRPIVGDVPAWTVTDDWPDEVPVIEAG